MDEFEEFKQRLHHLEYEEIRQIKEYIFIEKKF